MNNKYLLYGGLLLATVFTSCKQDAMFEESNNINLQKYVTEGIVGNEQSTRANVESDGITFYWQENDKITIWNGTTGYEFTSTLIEGSTGNSKWISQFQGDASLTDGSSVYGVYPATTGNPLSFTLNDEKRNQTDGNPALSNTMYMVAQGNVSGNTVSSLRFKHLTSIFQFNIKNNRPEDIVVESVKVNADEAVFPTVVTVSGEDATYSENVKSVSLKMNNQVIKNSETLKAYLNFLPTPELPAETELTFSAVLSDGSSITIKKGKAGELYEAGSGFAKDGYKYTAGKRYSINATIDLDESDPGYSTAEDGEYIVYAAKGLKAILSDNEIIGAEGVKIKLSYDINLEGTELDQIAEFKGTLNGDGKAISNYTLKNTAGNHFGLFKKNSGTIQNLNVKNITMTNVSVANGNDGASALVGLNSGTVKNCSAENVKLTLSSGKAAFGIIVGNNAGTIEGVNITNSSLTTNTECNLGLASGINNSTIKGTNTQGEITVNSYTTGGASSVGGIIGWAQGKSKVDGCSANVVIDCKMNTNSGGLIGANVGSIKVSYSNGEIKKSGSDNNGGGLVGSANSGSGYTACYSTTTLYSEEGGFVGSWGWQTQENNCTFSKCFFTTGVKAPITSNEVANVNNTELAGKINDMNSAATDSEYQFIVNEGTDKDKAPLIIVKKQ